MKILGLSLATARVTVPFLIELFALLFSCCFPSISAHGTPYASGATNSDGIIHFVLNENADSVKAIFNEGTATNDMGPLVHGTYAFNLGAYTQYQIVVTKNSPPGFLTPTDREFVDPENGVGSRVCFANQISSDTNVLLSFYSPHGVAINCNARSPFFGRVYVANAISAENVRSLGAIRHSTSRGIYMLNADCSDALKLGDVASPAGLAEVFSKYPSAPNRIFIGEDDQLYICDWYDSDGNIYVTDPNVKTWQYLLSAYSNDTPPFVPVGIDNNHGAISAAFITGNTKAGNLTLFTVDSYLQADRTAVTKLSSIWESAPTELNSLWRYDIGAGPLPYPGAPKRLWTPTPSEGVTTMPNITMDIDRSTEGYFFITTLRTPPVTCSGLVVRGSDSPLAPSMFSSFLASHLIGSKTNADILYGAAAVAVAPHEPYAAVLRQDGRAWILPLTNGIPDLGNRLLLKSFDSKSGGRAVRFDAAGNLYIVSSSEQQLRVFSPGGMTVATTCNNAQGTAGTFTLRRELPKASK